MKPLEIAGISLTPRVLLEAYRHSVRETKYWSEILFMSSPGEREHKRATLKWARYRVLESKLFNRILQEMEE